MIRRIHDDASFKTSIWNCRDWGYEPSHRAEVRWAKMKTLRSSGFGVFEFEEEEEKTEESWCTVMFYSYCLWRRDFRISLCIVSSIRHGITTLVGSSLQAPPRSVLPYRHCMRIKSLNRVWRWKQPVFYFVFLCISGFFIDDISGFMLFYVFQFSFISS